MGDEIAIAASVVVGLLLFYSFYLKWAFKRKLTKLQGGYNEAEDKSRPSNNFRRSFRRDRPDRPEGFGDATTDPTANSREHFDEQSETVPRQSLQFNDAMGNDARVSRRSEKRQSKPKRNWAKFE